MVQKIQEVEIFEIGDLSSERSSPWSSTMLILKLTTDDGEVGFGQAPTTLMTMPVLESLKEVKRSFEGKDVFSLNENTMNFYKNSFYLSRSMEATSALSAFDIASWDLIGKYTGEPIYKLLGGAVRDKIRLYANGWYSGCKTPDDFVTKAREVVKSGITAVKFDPFGDSYDQISRENLENASAVVEALRDEFGDSLDLLIEFHGRFSVDAAIKACMELDRYYCTFFEEPLHPELEDLLPSLRRRISTPIALGERILNARDFARNIYGEKVDIIQPDVTNCRGISELRNIYAIADSRGMPVAPHNAFGPIQTAATLNVDLSMNNFLIQESFENFWPEWKRKILNSGYKIENGYFELSNKPGLGIEINETILEERIVKGMEPLNP
ncbi:MAG: enolase C-terminal domain-like protein, partial [Thermoplasmataceae archaeon]